MNGVRNELDNNLKINKAGKINKCNQKQNHRIQNMPKLM